MDDVVMTPRGWTVMCQFTDNRLLYTVYSHTGDEWLLWMQIYRIEIIAINFNGFSIITIIAEDI